MSGKADRAKQVEFFRELISASLNHLPVEVRGAAFETIAFRESITEESGRGAALMAAAFIDDRLAKLIASHLIDDDALIKSMLDFNGPFGSFSSRIETSFGLGLIPGNVRRDLNLLRKIRNDFAHTAERLSFQDEPIASRCRELSLDGKAKLAAPRGKFTRAMIACVGNIEASILQAKRPEQAADFDVSINQNGIETIKQFLRDNGLKNLADRIG